MPKFKTLNTDIPGLIRHCSPIRNGDAKGFAIRDGQSMAMFMTFNRLVSRIAPDAIQRWTLDLRDLTGAFHAAQYIQEHFDALEKHGVGSAHDFETVLGDDSKASGVYYGAYVGAGQGDPLTTPERKALAKIVLWVAERVG